MIRRWAALCIWAAMALAQAPQKPGSVEKPGSVAGTVSNSVTGQPVKKATVTLHAIAKGFAYVAVSNAEGHFLMTGVEPGDGYQIAAECAGFTWEAVTRRNIARPISVGEEQAVTGVSVKLVPLGVVTGKVLDEDGDPLPGVTVQAVGTGYQMGAKRVYPSRSAQTDDRGKYRIFDLPAGRFFFLAALRNFTQPAVNVRNHSEPPEQAYAATLYPGAGDIAGAAATAIAPGAEISGIDFRLHKVRVYYIRGKAVDAQTRQAVRGAAVQSRLCAASLESTAAGQMPVHLQPDGTFDIPGAVTGRYCLTIQQSLPGGHISFAQQTVNVAGRDVEDVVLSVMPGLEIPGMLLFEGPPPGNFRNLRVALAPVGGDANYLDAAIKPDNSFVLQDIVPGSYQWQRISLPAGFYLKSMQYGERAVADGRLDVTAAGTPLTLVLAPDSGQVSVTVRNADGSPAAGITVLLAPEGRYALRPDLLRTAMTMKNGVARINGVAPGEYKVFAWEEMDQTLAPVPEFRKLLESRAAGVSVEANGRHAVQTPLISLEQINEAKSKLP